MAVEPTIDVHPPRDIDPTETAEWVESIEAVLYAAGPDRARFLLQCLIDWGRREGVVLPFSANTPYINTIPASETPPYPGDRALERRIKSLVRWNAVAMVVRANRRFDGIGGHISTYQSAATLYEVGFNHFFRGRTDDSVGDQIYFQGHAAPGIYARAFIEGRFDAERLAWFRRGCRIGEQLASYPHPWLMPDFWQFPTVSMGLGAIGAIYQARFNRYLQDRGIKNTEDSKVWCFLGDGECDEPETLGALTLASREGLDNLIFVVNCNLQRLDGPVRGNGKIIQELEAAFRGAGWNVIKVIWGEAWDPLFDADEDGLLVWALGERVDGDYQRYSVQPGSKTRREFFGLHPKTEKLVEQLSDDQIKRLRRGGHDPVKVHAAYQAAVEHKGQPTVILAKTIKGYGLGEAGEGRNITHQQKKLNEEELRHFRDRFDIPISDDQLAETPFYRPPEDSPEIQYVLERRRILGGHVPSRVVSAPPLAAPKMDLFAEFLKGTGNRKVATTQACVRMLTRLMDDKTIGRYIVPIVPDEARTFGMDALFRKYGIYAHKGQLYDPVDSDLLLYYREAKDGQLLEEGITEAGSMGSFTAAGTCYATHGVTMIPFFFFYSMFGFQRVADQIWQFADMRGRGFLIGATAGRTTLAGEGLQHQDGHSLLVATTVPNCLSYDAAYAYELAVIIQEGLRRMYEDGEDVFYYLTVENEPYTMPPMPDGVSEGILKGMYRLRGKPSPDREGAGSDPSPDREGAGFRGRAHLDTPSHRDRPFVHLFGSGAILRGVLEAQQVLAEKFDVASDVWSVTSYTQLRREALDCERWNRLHPDPSPDRKGAGSATEPLRTRSLTVAARSGRPIRIPYITKQLAEKPAPVIAATDYVKLVADQVGPWTPQGMVSLGTDGFGRSETRVALRRFFEVDAAHIVVAALSRLADDGKVSRDLVTEAIRDFDITVDSPPPAHS